MSEASRLTLAGLPLELQEAILSQSDSIHTIRAAAVAGRCFHEALQGSGGSMIIARVFSNIIPPSLQREALAVFTSSQRRDLIGWTRRRFLDLYFGSLNERVSNRLTVREIASLEAFHGLVSKFARDFAFRALSYHPRTGLAVDKAEPLPPSAQELQRIERAFYRFELYCNLFHAPPGNTGTGDTLRKAGCARGDAWCEWRHDILADQSKTFFSRFAVWENEQLASVYEYLYQEISAPFNDVAAHDVDWGMQSICYLGHESDYHRFHYLSLGLKFINRARRAKTYSQRERVLKSNFGVKPMIFIQQGLHHFNFLGSGLTADQFRTPLSDYDVTLMALVLIPPSVPEPDPGPDEVWRATHYECTRPDFMMTARHSYLRQRGYVFWDHGRLADWDLLTFRWENDLCVEEREPTASERRVQARSKQRRKAIYRAGGRGWWTKDDESRIMYPD